MYKELKGRKDMVSAIREKTIILCLVLVLAVCAACDVGDALRTLLSDSGTAEPAEAAQEVENPAPAREPSQNSSGWGRLPTIQQPEPAQNSSGWGRLPTIQQPAPEQNTSGWGRLSTILGGSDQSDEEVFHDSEQRVPFYEAERMIAERFSYEGEGELTRNISRWDGAIELYHYELHWYGDNTHYYSIQISSFTGEMIIEEIEYDYAQDMLEYWRNSQR